MSDLCIACGKVVGKRQHGVTCDICDRFQHRICGTGNNYFIIRYILKNETLWFVYVNIVHVCFCLFKLLARHCIAKYLGITISDDLDWGQHISEISSKATKTLGFLRRNLAFAPRHTKEVAYKTLVRPKLEYAAPIWHPYHETQIGQVEKVQRTAARWTCRRWRNTSSVGDMLDNLEWPSLETRREQISLTFFYKIHSGTVDLDKDKYLTPAPNLRRTRASHES